MAIHIHTLRVLCASALLLVPAPVLLGWAMAPVSTDIQLAQVSGRMTCANQPLDGSIYFMPDRKDAPYAVGTVKSDGSFDLYVNGSSSLRGAVPGTYRVFVQPRASNKIGKRVDKKYQDPRKTDLRVSVVPDWNYVCFNFH